MRLHGQAVKTSPFHGGNPGSIPGGVTKKGTQFRVPFLVTPPFISPVFKVLSLRSNPLPAARDFCHLRCNLFVILRIVCTVQKKKLPFSHKISSIEQKLKSRGAEMLPVNFFVSVSVKLCQNGATSTLHTLFALSCKTLCSALIPL